VRRARWSSSCAREGRAERRFHRRCTAPWAAGPAQWRRSRRTRRRMGHQGRRRVRAEPVSRSWTRRLRCRLGRREQGGCGDLASSRYVLDAGCPASAPHSACFVRGCWLVKAPHRITPPSALAARLNPLALAAAVAQLKLETPTAGGEDDEDEYTPSSEMRIQSRNTAGGADRHARRRASVEAEQAALMVRFFPFIPVVLLPAAGATELLCPVLRHMC
jgi:hypothetical protein